MSDEQTVYAAAAEAIDGVYETMDGSGVAVDYHERHGVNSLLILTVSDYLSAAREVDKLWHSVKDKTVIEIGAGVGMLAMQVAKFARRVYAIEADPAWAWVFTRYLYETKPANLTYIFGRAEEMVGILSGDVAVVYSNSDVPRMMTLAGKFAPEVVRGPLCSFREQHADLTDADVGFIERVASRVGLENYGMRGFSKKTLEAALAAEEKAP